MPDWRPEIMKRLEGSRLRPESEQELVEELSQHLDDMYAELTSQGTPDAKARALAVAELDAMNVARAAREKARPWRGSNLPLGGTGGEGISAVLADLRFGVRLLLHNRGLAAAAILTLAIGIGANTAIVSAVNAVVLRPLPFPHAERLYKVWEENPVKGWYKQQAAPANYLDWQTVDAFEGVAAYSPPFGEGGVTLLGEGAPRTLRAANVTGNFFEVLGVRPLQGRMLTDAETWSGTEPVVVISENLWRTQYGGAAVLDRQIRLNGTSYRIVGIMPAGFTFPNEPDVWAPVGWDPANRNAVWFRRAHWLDVVARVRPGVSAEQANAQLQAVASRLKVQYPETNSTMGAGMTPLHEFIVGDTRTPLLVLLSAVGLLLLIACTNVGNLLLVKATTRTRELAVRRALGASSLRITRQLLTEGLVLATAGSIAGVGLGWLMTRALERLQPAGLLSETTFTMDRTVLLYVVGITVLAGLMFGAIPALSLRQRRPARALAEGGRTGAPGRGTRRAANALVVVQVAIAVMLVIGAGLLLRTFRELQRVDSGVDPRGVLAVTVSLQTPRYDSASARLHFFQELESRAAVLPFVEDVALASNAPLRGLGYTSDFAVAGRAREDFGSEIAHRMITPAYFETMRVPLLQGRTFTDADRATSAPVVIINKATADRHFRNENPVGQRISFDKYPDSASVWRTIVGVVGNEHQRGPASAPALEVFKPLTQEVTGFNALLLRSHGDDAALTASVRAVINEIDPDLAIQSVKSIEELLANSMARQRFLMTMLLLFALIALLLAVVGVYGVTAQGARQRRQEIGVRLAMGADARNIVILVVRQAATLVTFGIVCGVGAALYASRALSSMLFGVSTTDPVTYIAVVGVLLVTGIAASWVPARAASRSDPATVLRVE